MNNHTDLLNYLICKYHLTNYLEIGVSNPENNFDKIKAVNKTGVDPNQKANATCVMTSDEYFQDIANSNNKQFNLIFIDGLHHADQVQRDFENSLIWLADNGFIVLHDTCPEKEDLTAVPRNKRGRWLGDVYKFVCRLNAYDGIDFCTLDFDNGCTIVWKARGKAGESKIVEDLEPIDWATYRDNKYLLRRIELKYFLSLNV
jgi:hypothetical protein